MREAASTSILSRRWRYQWRTSLNLNFDVTNMNGENCRMNVLEYQDSSLLQQKKSCFVKWVNQILKLHCGRRIESFRVEYGLGEEYNSDIDQWIRFAVNKEVQRLDIILSNSNSSLEDDKLYTFPYFLFTRGRGSTLKHLSLSSCTLSLPPRFSNFISLTSLTLKDTSLTEENVQNILSNCLCLQCLSITNCFCPIRLKFGVGCSSLKLKHLNLSACYHLKEIEIYDSVNLASFEYRGAMLGKLLCRNVAQLARLCFCTVWDPLAGIRYALGNLASDFPQLETLLLTSPHVKEDMIPKQLPAFTKLKYLVLICIGSHPESLLELTVPLLKASPFLCKFEIHLPLSSGNKNRMRKKIPREECHQHEHLKEVKMYNFHGDLKEVELLVYLLNSAIALEKITIGRSFRLYQGDGEWLNIGSLGTIRRKQVYKMLRKKVPSTTRLIVQ